MKQDMKKLLMPLLGALLVCLGLGMQAKAQTMAGKKVLVVYLSRSGNTRAVAQKIQQATGADLFELQLAKPYPSDYQQLVAQFKAEVKSKRWPALKTKVENLAQYDVVFVGSPNWGSTIAPPVSTFLSTHNLKGKTIVPFMTHGGGGWGHSREDMKMLCPQSTFLEGLELSGRQATSAGASVDKWLRKLGFSR